MINQLRHLLLVQDGEGRKVAYFFAFFMLVSAGMAIGRGTADAMFLKRLGIEYLPLMYMVQSVVLSVVCLAYTAFADRIIAEKFFRTIFLVLVLLVFGAWLSMTLTSSRLTYPAYYLIYEVASEVLLVHAALYMNQNMTTLQAKRLTPLFFGGAQAGTIVGGLLLAFAAPVTGPKNILIVWCLLLLVCTVLLVAWHRKHGPSKYYSAPSRSRHIVNESVDQIRQGMRYTWSSGLLRAASASLFFMVISFYVLCYSVNRVYSSTFPTENELAGFFGSLTAATSTIALLAQIFITGRVIERFGVRRVNLVFPMTTFAALGGLAGSFTLPFALLGSLNKDSLMPAFRNPVKVLFYNVVPDYMQGRARAISVAVILPAAMFCCGLMLMIMQRLENPLYFLVPGMAAAVFYLFFNARMNHAYTRTLIDTLKEKLFLPKERMYADLSGSNRAVIDEIIRGVNQENPDVAVAFARLLAESFPDIAAGTIVDRAHTADTKTANQLLSLLSGTDMNGQLDKLRELSTQHDAHFQATIMRLVTDQDAGDNSADISNLLAAGNPRLRATGIHAALRQAGPAKNHNVIEQWIALLSGDENECLAAFDIMSDVAPLDSDNRVIIETAYYDAFRRLLKTGGQGSKIRVLRALSHWQPTTNLDLQAIVESALQDSDPDLRAAVAACIHHLDAANRDGLFLRAAGDSHPRVRQAAIDAIGKIHEDYPQIALELLNSNRGDPRAQQTLLESIMETPIPHAEFANIAAKKAAEALLLQQALHVLDTETVSETAAYSIIVIALKERLEQTIQLALQALEPLHEPGLIQTIRAGFASRDERHIANAREALQTLDSSYVKDLLENVLQDSAGNPPPGHERPFQGIKEVIDWCSRHADVWLNECAQYTTRQLLTDRGHG